jgi:hypothetical protein
MFPAVGDGRGITCSGREYYSTSVTYQISESMPMTVRGFQCDSRRHIHVSLLLVEGHHVSSYTPVILQYPFKLSSLPAVTPFLHRVICATGSIGIQ